MAATLGLDPKNSRIHLKDSEEEVRGELLSTTFLASLLL